MAVIQTLRGANFNNPALPRMAGQFISVGLLAGYRAGEDFRTDLSGNNKTLVAIGSPTQTPSHAVLNPENHYDTGVMLPAQFTLITVFRLASNPSSNQFVMGDYASPGGAGQGLVLFSRANNVAGMNMHTTDKPGGIYSGVEGPTVNGEFVWQAATFGAGQTKWRIPKASYVNDRTYSGSVVASPNTVKVGTTHATPAGTVNRHVVEVLIFNRVLSDAELQQQYGYSQEHAATLGIEGI